MKLVLVEELESGMTLAEDVFASEDSVSPIIRGGIVLTDYVIAHMKRRGIRSVYVERTGENEDEDAEEPQSPPALDPALQKEALTSIEELFLTAGQKDGPLVSAQTVQHLDSVVHRLVDSLVTVEKTLVNITDLKSFDDYTYHHSLSVAVLAIAMGQYLGMSEVELNRLGTSAILHDIGKTAIPIDLIRKSSKLSPQEFDLIKTHSSAGYNYLTKNNIGDVEIWQGVLCHHERIDGSGYPGNLRGIDIPKWSRIISVADVYDALTSFRPYRRPMQPADAIEYIMGGTGSAFDFDMVTALVRKVDLYPVGSRVELSNGHTAMVMDNDNQMRPIVCLESNGDLVDLYRDRRYLSVVINRLVLDTADTYAAAPAASLPLE